MAEFRRPESAAGPVVASQVQVGREGAAVGLRAGQGVVPVRRHAEAGDHVAALGQGRVLVEVAAGTVEIVYVLGDDDALGTAARRVDPQNLRPA